MTSHAPHTPPRLPLCARRRALPGRCACRLRRLAHRRVRLGLRRADRRAGDRQGTAAGKHCVRGRLGSLPLWPARPVRSGRLRAADRRVAGGARRQAGGHRVQHGHGGGPRACAAHASRAGHRRGGAGVARCRACDAQPPRGRHRHEGHGGIRRLHACHPPHRRGHHRVLHGHAAFRGNSRAGHPHGGGPHRKLHVLGVESVHPPGVPGDSARVPGTPAPLRHRHAGSGMHALPAAQGAYRRGGGARG